MNIYHNVLLKKAAVVCCFLLLKVNITKSQSFSHKCLKKYSTKFSYINDDILPIFNLVNNAGVNVKTYDKLGKLNYFFFRNDSVIFKEIPIDYKNELAYFISSFDSTSVVLLNDIKNYPILLFKQNNKGEFELKDKIDLTKQKKIRNSDDIFFQNENSIILGSSYIFRDFKKIGLAKVNVKQKKIIKSISFPINKYEFRYSHFPKQWITVNKNNIAVVRPFAQEIILLDASLNILKKIDINSLNLINSEKIFFKTIDTNLLNKYDFYPKNIIDYFYNNQILNIRRIEKIAFINNDVLLLSVVDSLYKYKRQLYLLNINNNKIIDSLLVDYRDKSSENTVDTRYSAQLYFDEKERTFSFEQDSINENEIYYKIKQFKLQKTLIDSINSISSKLLLNTDIKTVKNEISQLNYICNFNKVLFMNMLFCFSDYCLKDIERNELLIYITNTDNYTSNLSIKNMLEKKYKFENILFINETKFKEQLPNVIPNKQYYILTK